LLVNYDWPGNIRELRNAIERIMILAEGNRMAAKYLPIRISEGGAAALPAARREGNGLFTLPPSGETAAHLPGHAPLQGQEAQARLKENTRHEFRGSLWPAQLAEEVGPH